MAERETQWLLSYPAAQQRNPTHGQTPPQKKGVSGDMLGISYCIYLRHSSPPDYYMFGSTGKRLHKDGAVFCRCARAASVARCKFMSLFTAGKSIPASLAHTRESNTLVLQHVYFCNNKWVIE